MARTPIPAAVGALALAGVLGSGCVIDVDDDPYIEVYEPCSRSWQCEWPADACWRIAVDYGDWFVSDRMCTLECNGDRDCPWGGACYSVQGDVPLCYQRCDRDWQCPTGFACIDTVGGWTGDAICLPW